MSLSPPRLRRGFGLVALTLAGVACALSCPPPHASAADVAAAAADDDDDDWEITAESEAAVERGLRWLAANQGPEGNWGSTDLGLVAVGGLAFLAAGHMPGIGEHGVACERALAHVVTKAKPSGLLNIADGNRDMYNHGLATFVLGQAYGMTADPRVGKALDRALDLIARTQGPVGGWAYQAVPQDGDLSLSVMQAKALRSAVDSGFEIPPSVIDKAIANVRGHYTPRGGNPRMPEAEQQKLPGQFTYGKGSYKRLISLTLPRRASDLSLNKGAPV